MSNSYDDVAQWMIDELKKSKCLYQEIAVHEIASKFGDSFYYFNNNGNLAIHKKVLDAFRRLTEGDVIWERGQRMWRFREKFDEPGRQQF